MGKVSRILLLLSLLVPLLSILPTAISQTNLTTVTRVYTLTSSVGTGTYTTVTSIQKNTTSLTINLPTSVNSTYTSTINSTSTVTTTSTSTSMAANPTFGTNGVLLLVVNVIVAVFLIFAVIRYVRRRRK